MEPLPKKEKLAIPEIGVRLGVGVGRASLAMPKSSKVLQATLGLLGSAPVCGGAAAKPFGAWLSRMLVSWGAAPVGGVADGEEQVPVSTVASHSIVLP